MNFDAHVMGPLTRVWKSQELLPQVLRWGRYLKEGERIHRQCLAQHVWGVQLVAAAVVHAVREHTVLDSSLLLHAFLVHDHGEAELGRDHCAPVKRAEHDLEEYHAFVQRFGLLDEATFHMFRRAFLLQFVLPGKDELLPQCARLVTAELRETHYREAVAFRLIELLDYLAYAMAQWFGRNNYRILADVIESSRTEIDDLALQLPGFRETVWTDAYREDLFAFADFAERQKEDRSEY